MNKKQILSLGAVAALTALAPRVNAADAQVKAHVDTKSDRVETTRDRDADLRIRKDRDADGRLRTDREADVRVRTDRDGDTTTSDRIHQKIRHSDKASGILGMEVRNRENQKLGEVKDLVMDVNSGKVSYAVLAVGGFLGVGEKLIALPPSALRQAQDGEYLVLDADKSRIQAAPGFAATNWPQKGDSEVNQFWSEIRSTGSPARSETSRRSSEIDVDTGRKPSVKSEVNIDTDRNRTIERKIYTDADGDKKVKVDINTK